MHRIIITPASAPASAVKELHTSQTKVIEVEEKHPELRQVPRNGETIPNLRITSINTYAALSSDRVTLEVSHRVSSGRGGYVTRTKRVTHDNPRLYVLAGYEIDSIFATKPEEAEAANNSFINALDEMRSRFAESRAEDEVFLGHAKFSWRQCNNPKHHKHLHPHIGNMCQVDSIYASTITITMPLLNPYTSGVRAHEHAHWEEKDPVRKLLHLRMHEFYLDAAVKWHSTHGSALTRNERAYESFEFNWFRDPKHLKHTFVSGNQHRGRPISEELHICPHCRAQNGDMQSFGSHSDLVTHINMEHKLCGRIELITKVGSGVLRFVGVLAGTNLLHNGEIIRNVSLNNGRLYAVDGSVLYESAHIQTSGCGYTFPESHSSDDKHSFADGWCPAVAQDAYARNWRAQGGRINGGKYCSDPYH
jgi:hypothetical protein